MPQGEPHSINPQVDYSISATFGVYRFYWSVVMPKKILFALVFILLAATPVLGKSVANGPVIKTLDRHLEDVGCVYYLRKAQPNDFPVFLNSSGGTWMDIDGEKRQLMLDDSYEGKNSSRYTAGEYQIYLEYGRAKVLEGGVDHKRAKITVQKQGSTTLIKVKGGCGC